MRGFEGRGTGRGEKRTRTRKRKEGRNCGGYNCRDGGEAELSDQNLQEGQRARDSPKKEIVADHVVERRVVEEEQEADQGS